MGKQEDRGRGFNWVEMGLEEDERVKEQLLTGGLKIAKESIIAETR